MSRAGPWLIELMAGTPGPETLDHIQRGVQRWYNSATRGRRDSEGRRTRQRSPSLEQCLGLPANPMNARLAVRNHWLRQAAACLPANLTDCARARALAREASRFAGHQWLCWFHLDTPPTTTDINRPLFFAMRAGGGKLPQTWRQMLTILSE